jgi:tRNA(fMet)-specific endonuclease VapC
MLDTNICIFLLGKKKVIYFDRLDELQAKMKHNIAISAIVLAELQYGIANSKHKAQNQSELSVLLSNLDIFPYTDKSAFYYGKIRAALKKKGCIIGGNDLLIASHAIAEEAILVTNNTKEFQRIEGLGMLHWEQ